KTGGHRVYSHAPDILCAFGTLSWHRHAGFAAPIADRRVTGESDRLDVRNGFKATLDVPKVAQRLLLVVAAEMRFHADEGDVPRVEVVPPFDITQALNHQSGADKQDQ